MGKFSKFLSVAMLAASASVASMATDVAIAQDYPNQPVTIVVPFPPGPPPPPPPPRLDRSARPPDRRKTISGPLGPAGGGGKPRAAQAVPWAPITSPSRIPMDTPS